MKTYHKRNATNGFATFKKQLAAHEIGHTLGIMPPHIKQ
jgi:hypothetical protein